MVGKIVGRRTRRFIECGKHCEVDRRLQNVRVLLPSAAKELLAIVVRQKGESRVEVGGGQNAVISSAKSEQGMHGDDVEK